MIELLIQNKDDGKIFEMSEAASSVSYSDSLNNGCGKLELKYLYDGVVFSNGSIVRFRYNGADIFFGYVFKYERDNGTEVTITAYDQLRYLKSKDTLAIKGIRLDQLVSKIAGMFKLELGTLDNTGYILPTSVQDNQTYLDMIYNSISRTLLGSGKKYSFYDRFGSLFLTDLQSLRLPLVIGDQSLAYGFKFEQSIDDNFYNQIKLVSDNESTGKRDVYIERDSSSIDKYGLLQYYEAADKNENAEQLKAKAAGLLKLMNRETKSLSLDAIGDTRVRSGNSILVDVSGLGIKQYLIIDSCKHTFKQNNHTMSMELVL